MKILFIGDIVGKTGRLAVSRLLPRIVSRHATDFVIANVENAASGIGVTATICEGFLAGGIDVLTSGNHIWDKAEALDYIREQPRLLRPANYPEVQPGQGSLVAKDASGRKIGVLNLEGNVFMRAKSCPFATADREVERLRQETRVVVVDMHGEATSEKIAMGWHLDGRVSAVLGTHTHVQTADERVLPGGTAFMTDCGMTGPHDSVIGVKKELALARFTTGLPRRFETAKGDGRLNGVVIDIDEETGRARGIVRVSERLDEPS